MNTLQSTIIPSYQISIQFKRPPSRNDCIVFSLFAAPSNAFINYLPSSWLKNILHSVHSLKDFMIQFTRGWTKFIETLLQMIFIDTFYQQIKTAEFVVNVEPLGVICLQSFTYENRAQGKWLRMIMFVWANLYIWCINQVWKGVNEVIFCLKFTHLNRW